MAVIDPAGLYRFPYVGEATIRSLLTHMSLPKWLISAINASMDNQNQPAAEPTKAAHTSHKVIISLLGLVIVILIAALITKPAEAPEPAASESANQA